jgi:hypothetical protein
MKRLLSRPMRSSRRPSPRGFATIELPIVLLLFSLGVFYFAATLRFVTRVLEPTGGMAVLGVLGALATAGFLFYMTVYFSLHIAERLSHRLGGECFLLPFVAPLAVPLFLNAAPRSARCAPCGPVGRPEGLRVPRLRAGGLPPLCRRDHALSPALARPRLCSRCHPEQHGYAVHASRRIIGLLKQGQGAAVKGGRSAQRVRF